MTDEEIELVERAWLDRGRAALDDGFSYPFPLINEGRDAGASLPHSHSQIVFLREPPPAALARRDPGAVEGILGRRDAEGILKRRDLLVAEETLVAAVVHPAGRVPYELLIGGSDYLGAMLRVLRRCIQKLRTVEGPVPWNAWLYDLCQSDERPAYMEVVPRLTVMAGLELGAGIYVNPLPPEEAAARLAAA